MSASNYEDLMLHVGHDIETVTYGNQDNVAIECNTCNDVLVDYDKPAPTWEQDLKNIMFAQQLGFQQMRKDTNA